jgi:hypothetical protein
MLILKDPAYPETAAIIVMAHECQKNRRGVPTTLLEAAIAAQEHVKAMGPAHPIIHRIAAEREQVVTVDHQVQLILHERDKPHPIHLVENQAKLHRTVLLNLHPVPIAEEVLAVRIEVQVTQAGLAVREAVRVTQADPAVRKGKDNSYGCV